jgi:hypothetical protein
MNMAVYPYATAMLMLKEKEKWKHKLTKQTSLKIWSRLPEANNNIRDSSKEGLDLQKRKIYIDRWSTKADHKTGKKEVLIEIIKLWPKA